MQLCHADLHNEFPPLRTSDAVVAQHLPEQITSLVGRETQIADLQCLLAADRLVTLTGAGGTGKTRLTLETVIRAIAANLPTAPALMGNTVLWKPAPTQQLAAHYNMRLLEQAGLPSGVINMLTGDGCAVSEVALVKPRPRRHPLHRFHRDFRVPMAHRE